MDESPRLNINHSSVRGGYEENDYTSRFKIRRELDGSGNTIYTHEYTVSCSEDCSDGLSSLKLQGGGTLGTPSQETESAIKHGK